MCWSDFDDGVSCFLGRPFRHFDGVAGDGPCARLHLLCESPLPGWHGLSFSVSVPVALCVILVPDH
jgi:hypothetical protein